jgi:hypothetical protein
VQREQDVQVEIGQRPLQRHEADALQHHVAPPVRQDFLLDSIAAVSRRVVEAIRRNARLHL